MARRWFWGLLIAAGIGAAGVASLPSVIEWQGTRLVRELLLPSAVVDVVHFGLSGTTVEISEQGRNLAQDRPDRSAPWGRRRHIGTARP